MNNVKFVFWYISFSFSFDFPNWIFVGIYIHLPLVSVWCQILKCVSYWTNYGIFRHILSWFIIINVIFFTTHTLASCFKCIASFSAWVNDIYSASHEERATYFCFFLFPAYSCTSIDNAVSRIWMIISFVAWAIGICHSEQFHLGKILVLNLAKASFSKRKSGLAAIARYTREPIRFW